METNRKKISEDRGFTLVEIMFVVSILIILSAIVIPNVLRVRMIANGSAARATLKTISNACENYAAANNGIYPTGMDVLTTGDEPAYLNEDYTISTKQGYIFTCETMTITGYSCTAIPASTSLGSKIFTIITGGILTSAEYSP